MVQHKRSRLSRFPQREGNFRKTHNYRIECEILLAPSNYTSEFELYYYFGYIFHFSRLDLKKYKVELPGMQHLTSRRDLSLMKD